MNSELWQRVSQEAQKFGSDQSAKFIEKKGSMCDRLYGLEGFVLALLVVLEKSSNASRKEILELLSNFYYISVKLLGAAAGFCLPEIREKFSQSKDLWLELCVKAGIGVIPISVHMYFRLPEIVECFGAPILYSCF